MCQRSTQNSLAVTIDWGETNYWGWAGMVGGGGRYLKLTWTMRCRTNVTFASWLAVLWAHLQSYLVRLQAVWIMVISCSRCLCCFLTTPDQGFVSHVSIAHYNHSMCVWVCVCIFMNGCTKLNDKRQTQWHTIKNLLFIWHIPDNQVEPSTFYLKRNQQTKNKTKKKHPSNDEPFLCAIPPDTGYDNDDNRRKKSPSGGKCTPEHAAIIRGAAGDTRDLGHGTTSLPHLISHHSSGGNIQ